VIRLKLVSHTSLFDRFRTLGTLDGKFGFPAFFAVWFVILRMESFLTNDFLTSDAFEALFVPFSTVPTEFHGTCLERSNTCSTFGREILVPAVTAEKLVVLGTERLADKRVLAFSTLEALVMPMFILESEILVVDRDDFVTVSASMSELFVITLHAVWMSILVDEPRSVQGSVTLPTSKICCILSCRCSVLDIRFLLLFSRLLVIFAADFDVNFHTCLALGLLVFTVARKLLSSSG
jgi:hypothetical protein